MTYSPPPPPYPPPPPPPDEKVRISGYDSTIQEWRAGQRDVVLVQSSRSRGRAQTPHCEAVISRGLMDGR